MTDGWKVYPNFIADEDQIISKTYSNPKSVSITGSQAEPGNQCHSCSASPATIEAEPLDLRYQADPGNEQNHLGLLYMTCS